MKRIINNLIIFSIVIFVNASLFSQTNIPDSSKIRASIRETWLEAPLALLRDYRAEIRTNDLGEEFQIRLEESDTEFSIVIAPNSIMKMDFYSKKEKPTVLEDVFTNKGPGSCVLIRDKITGKPKQIVFYFSESSDVYIQFSPEKDTSYGDFIIFNGYAARHVPTGIPFERLYSISFNEIKKITKTKFPWKYADIYPGMYDSTLEMIKIIRESLPNIVATDDAMYDEYRKPIYIISGKERNIYSESEGKLSLSKAGFLKWIADGIIYPITQGGLKREALLTETVEYNDVGYQGILSGKNNISFSLNWTRNLATAILSVRTGKKYMYNNSGVDVKEEPFRAEFTADGVKSTLGYVKNSGYASLSLQPILYALAASNPGEFYFAAIRQTDRTKSPEVKVFNECAAIFPYFDENKQFKCVVFTNDGEYTLNQFLGKFNSDYVHLTRVKATNSFEVQK